MIKIKFATEYRLGSRLIPAGAILSIVNSVAKRLIDTGYAVDPDAPVVEPDPVPQEETADGYAVDGEIVPSETPLEQELIEATTAKRSSKKKTE